MKIMSDETSIDIKALTQASQTSGKARTNKKLISDLNRYVLSHDAKVQREAPFLSQNFRVTFLNLFAVYYT